VESVVDGRTGVLFAEQTVDGLEEAIVRFEGMHIEGESPRENASRFGRDRFRAQMAGAIDRASRVRRE
jgi:hypothetical protein